MAAVPGPHSGNEQAPKTPPRRWQDLPGPRAWPVLGHRPRIDPARMHLQLEQWGREYGPYYRLKLGGPVLVVAEHEVIASVLRNRPDVFQRTPRLNQVWLEMGLPPGIFGSNGEAWKRQRRMVMSSFDPAHVKDYYPALQQVAQRLAGRWRKAARAQAPIDLQSDLMRYTVDTIAGLAFGAQVNTLESDADVIQRHLDRIFPTLSRRILAPVPTWRWLRSARDRELEHGVAEVKAAVGRFIDAARVRLHADPVRRERPPNLLEAMLVAADEPASGIDDAQVAGNVVTMLLAGEDTTANTIAWMIDLLWRNPDALARASDEVQRVLGDEREAAPGFEQIAQLDWIEACAHETMRLKPVAPLLALRTEQEIGVGDVRVPAGTIVISLMRSDGVSEREVPDAANFRPERWLATDAGRRQASAAASLKRVSMPFGAGPRICPGRYLALLEIKVALATLLSRFEIAEVATRDGGPARERLSFTMTPVGLAMRLRERG